MEVLDIKGYATLITESMGFLFLKQLCIISSTVTQF